MILHRKVQLDIDHHKKIKYHDKNQQIRQVIENENFQSSKEKSSVSRSASAEAPGLQT
jgi:hypothetical protein